MILILCDSIPSMGGTRSFLLNILRENEKRQIKTNLVLPKSSIDEELISLCKKSGINLVPFKDRSKIFKKPYLAFIYDVVIYLTILKKLRPNLILASIGTPGLFLGLFFLNKPLIYFLHTYPFFGSNRFFDKSLSLLFSSNFKRVVTVSEFSKNKLREMWGVDQEHISVIYNGVKTPGKLSSYENIILTVGHVVDYKNPFTWIETVKIVTQKKPNVKFFWAGEGDLLDQMKVKVIDYNLQNNVFFLGLVKDPKVLYLKACIYFHPSIIENHSISIVEAMSYGLPCVVSNIGGNPESVEDGVNGFLLDPLDYAGFAERILFLLDNRNKLENMGQNGYNKFLSFFTLEDNFDKISHLYRYFNISYLNQD